MHNLLTNGSLAIAAYALARSGDLAFTYAITHSIIRCAQFVWFHLES